jgi:hypothetical protein
MVRPNTENSSITGSNEVDPNCKLRPRKGSSSSIKSSISTSTPSLKKIEVLNSNIPSASKNSSSSTPIKTTVEDKPNSILNELSSKLDSLFNDKFKTLELQFESLETNLSQTIVKKIEEEISKFDQKITDAVTDLNLKIEDINRKLTEIEEIKVDERLIALESQTIESLDTDFLLESLNNRISELERLNHLNDLVISGVTYKENENLHEIISKIAGTFNSSFDVKSIKSIFRIKNRTKTIIVKFFSTEQKIIFFSNYLKFKNLKNIDIGFESSSRIYINESIPKYTQFLLKLATKIKKDRWIHKVFTYKGFLFIIKKEGDDPIQITSKSQLIQSNNANKSILLQSNQSNQSMQQDLL